MKDIEIFLQDAISELAGFKMKETHANSIVNSATVSECLELSRKLLVDERYQVRELAVFILGNIAVNSSEALEILKVSVSKDSNWRVQEILAKAFDRFCSENGYEASLPTIMDWLANDNPNTRRAVTEGLRIWTNRDYFKTNQNVAIRILSNLRFDVSEYVRKSVGNALRDIGKKYPDLLRNEFENWVLIEKEEKQVYDLASKFITKEKTI